MESPTSSHLDTGNNGAHQRGASNPWGAPVQEVPSQGSIARIRRVTAILEEAELMVEFACRNALRANGLDEETLNNLILRVAQARLSLDSGEFDSEDEAQLLKDLRCLSLAFHPVSIRSIRDSSNGMDSRFKKFFFWGSPISQAAVTVRRFTCCFCAALLLLLLVQVIWLVGYDLVERIRVLHKEIAAETRLAGGAQTVDSSNRDTQERALSGLLSRWWDLVGFGIIDGNEPSKPRTRNSAVNDVAGVTIGETDGPQSPDDRGVQNEILNAQDDQKLSNQILVMVETELNILQTYVLPLLYGFLGTCAYILRQLTLETRARTFRGEAEIAYWLRIFLGLLAGLAIGWFLRPEEEGESLIRGLTPFALSFLAGYSVEVLFSGMDRFVTAFGASNERQGSV